MSRETVLVTGCAGFIGYHVSKRLLGEGRCVVGLDNLNDYYDVALKQARLDDLARGSLSSSFHFHKGSIEDRDLLARLFAQQRFDVVVHLAAQAGVTYSFENPHAYIEANIEGFLTILEACRRQEVRHLLYASSSSVYGASAKLPYSEDDPASNPVSLYAATKRSNELMAHAYASAFGLRTTGLRFFTAYGPWGRPDMAVHSFTRAIRAGLPIEVYGEGLMRRDFTYIDDLVEAVMRLADKSDGCRDGIEEVEVSETPLNYQLYNIGHGHPVTVNELITVLESRIGRKAICQYKPARPGEMQDTLADVGALFRKTGYRPMTSLEDGIDRFVTWYESYYS